MSAVRKHMQVNGFDLDLDESHVVAYYEHWSVNEVYNKTSVYSWSNRNSTNKSWDEMYYPFKTTVTSICHCDLLGY